MSFEDDFDSQLRETFIVVLFMIFCFAVCFVTLFGRSKREDMGEPLLCMILSTLSLSFALSSLFVVPVDQAIQAFPPAVNWLGIDGGRLVRTYASISLMGSAFAFLLLNPFAFLYGETADATWKSFWTTLLELVLVLLMLFSMGMMYFTRSTITEALLDPTKVVTKLASILIHGPGCLMILYLGPRGMARLISASLSKFVPWTSEYVPDDARRLRTDLKIMREWSKKRQGNGHGCDMEELELEFAKVELAVKGYPVLRNIQATVYTLVASGLAVAVVFRVLLPNMVAEKLFSTHSPLLSFAVPSCFLLVCLNAFFNYSPVERFLNPQPEETIRATSRERMDNNGGLLRTDSDLSLVHTDSLSLAWFVTYVLMFCTSSPIVLAGMFGLDLSFNLACHPFLRHPWVATLYSVAFVFLFSRVLANDIGGAPLSEYPNREKMKRI